MPLLRKLLGAKDLDPSSSARADRFGAIDVGAAARSERATIEEASAHRSAGRHAESLAIIDGALAARPNDAGLRFARISTLLAWGRVREAREVLMELDAVHAILPGDEAKLASAYFAVGDLTQAETWIRRALHANPSSSDYMIRLAAMLHREGRLDEAIDTYCQALALVPADFDALMGLGSCELDRRDACAAEARFREAVVADERSAVAWAYLGVSLDRQDRGAEGRAAHDIAVKLEAATGNDVDAFLGLAGNMRDDARYADALTMLEPNLRRRQSAEAHTLYAHMLLVQGRLPEGWHHNEFRWLTEHFLERRPDFRRPVWDGQDLRGKTILLRAEQGMGDALQFARYAPLVKAQGAMVHLAVPRELVELAKGVHGVDRVCVLREDETDVKFDYHIPLLSLPRVFGTDVATIPAELPYVDVDLERAARWSARLAADRRFFKVGLVFGGNPHNLEDPYRSVPLAMLAPLSGIEGVRLYALQKGAREAEAANPPAGLDLVNLGPELTDFAETAAAILQMDLVISVCTSVAHLAGALGRPLWVMLHRAADWRWLTKRDDSPWYPTARLFRQTRRGDWTDVVDRVKEALQERVREKAPSVIPIEQVARAALPNVARPEDAPGFRPGFAAAGETRYGIVEYFSDDGAMGASVGWYGEWQQQQLELLVQLIRPGSTVLEVGAGVGLHALFLSRAMGESAHLLVAEARPDHLRALRQNLGANRVVQVTILRPPIGSVDALHLDRLDWLKISDAGSPNTVLEGALETMWRLRPAIFVSIVVPESIDDILRRLQGCSYRCWRYEASLFNPDNFNQRTNDIFDGRVSIALLAYPEESEVRLTLDGCIELG